MCYFSTQPMVWFLWLTMIITRKDLSCCTNICYVLFQHTTHGVVSMANNSPDTKGSVTSILIYVMCYFSTQPVVWFLWLTMVPTQKDLSGCTNIGYVLFQHTTLGVVSMANNGPDTKRICHFHTNICCVISVHNPWCGFYG